MARSADTRAHKGHLAIIPRAQHGDTAGDTVLQVFPIDSDDINGSPDAVFTISEAGKTEVDVTNTVAAGANGLSIWHGQDDSTALTGTLRGAYIQAVNGDTNTGASAVVRGIDVKAKAATGGGTVATLTGAIIEADPKNKNTTAMRGIEVSLAGDSGGTSTTTQGIVIFNNSSGAQTTAIALDINGGTATGHKAFTYDIRGQNGETISNATNGTWALATAALTLTGSITASGSTNGSIVISPIASGTGATTIQNSAGTPTITLPATTCTLPGLGLSNAWTDTNTFGVDATGTDVQFYTDLAGSNLLWDASDNTLEGTGSAFIAIGDTTAGCVTAGGSTMIYGYARQKTAALTGDLIGVRGNSRIGIDSASGKVIGGYFTAGNGDPIDDVGYELDIMRGVYAGVTSKAPADTTATINTARGYEVSMDLDQGTSGHAVTITNAQGLYIVYNTATAGSYATITNGYGVYIKNEATSGTGCALDAAVYVCDASIGGGLKGWDYGIDLSGVVAGFTTADIRLGKGETINNNTDGTIGFIGAINFCPAGGTAAASVGILGGAGISGATVDLGASGGKGFSFYMSSTSVNTAHTLEGFYVNVDFGNGTGATAAPHGEAGRFRASLKGSPTGVCGCHNTVEWISSGATCSGATYGTYSNLVFLNSTAGGGTLSGLCAELFSGGSSTDLSGATASILRLSIQGAVTAAKFTVPAIALSVPTDLVGDGLVFDDAATDATVGGKLRISVNNVAYWVLCADGHT